MGGEPPKTWECDVCGHLYDESEEGVLWEDLPDDWECPVCGAGKAEFAAAAQAAVVVPDAPGAEPREEPSGAGLGTGLGRARAFDGGHPPDGGHGRVHHRADEVAHRSGVVG